VLAADDQSRRRGHGGAHPTADRRRARRGRQLLPAVSPPRAAGPGRARVPAPRRVRGQEARVRSGRAVRQHAVDEVSRAVNPLRLIACVYAVLFAAVTSLNYVPGLTDSEGRTFGLFALDVFDDALHAASGLWAAIAAWWSVRATVIYFRWFGT